MKYILKMKIGKSRSISQCCIEDTINAFKQLLSEIPNYYNKQEQSILESFKKEASEVAEGNKEIETNIYNSLSGILDDYYLINDCFCEALFLSSYSFYERMLHKIIESNNISVVNANNISFVEKHIRSICAYLGIKKFDQNIECQIAYVDKNYRNMRNDIAHEGYSGFHQINASYIQSFLSVIKDILLDVNSQLEKNINSYTNILKYE